MFCQPGNLWQRLFCQERSSLAAELAIIYYWSGHLDSHCSDSHGRKPNTSYGMQMVCMMSVCS